MAAKVDLKKDRRDLYSPGKEPALIEVPPMQFLMVDGRGDPNAAPEYREAVGSLYGTAYRLKFSSKEAGADFVVPPLEGLWWAADMDVFLEGARDAWQWTMMIAVPGIVDDDLAAEVARASDPVRLDHYEEGRSAQVMHVGPYAAEAPTIERLHRYIEESGLERRGLHHEIYLSDPRRTAPERMRTVIRQPVAAPA
jgi:hypothetical protein